MTKKMTDEEIYVALDDNTLGGGQSEATDRFSNCLTDFGNITDPKEILPVVNEVIKEFPEEFAKIGIKKFIAFEPDPNAPDDYYLWTVE